MKKPPKIKITRFLTFVFLLLWSAIFGQSFNERIDLALLEDSAHISLIQLNEIYQECSYNSIMDTAALAQIEIAEIFFDNSISIDSAVYHIDKSIKILSDIESKSLNARSHYLRGFYLRKWDQYESSIQSLLKSKSYNIPHYNFWAEVQLGKLYKDRGEFSLAFKHYDNALLLAKDDIKKRINVFEYISFAYIIMDTNHGDKESIRWLDSLESGLDLMGQDADQGYYALLNYNKALSYYELNEIEKAKKHLNKSLNITRECCDDPDFIGLITEFQGGIDIDEGRYQQGIAKLKKGTQLFDHSFDLTRSEGLAGIFSALSNAYLKWNKLDSALLFINAAINDRLNSVNDSYYIESPNIESKIVINGEKNYLIDDFRNKASIFKMMWKQNSSSELLDSALTTYKHAELALESMSSFHLEEETRVFWRKEAKNIYQEIIQLYLRKSNIKAAFNYVEKSKYVLLEEHLKSNQLQKDNKNDTAITYKSLKTQITLAEELYQNAIISQKNIYDQREKLLKLRNDEEQFKIKLRKEELSLYNELFHWTPPNIDTIQNRLLNANQKMISYFIHDTTYLAFILDGHDIVYRNLKSYGYIDSLSLQFYKTLTNTHVSAADYQDQALRLYNSLFIDVFDSSLFELIIIPDGNLHLIPFEALVTDLIQQPTFRNIKYLLRKTPLRLLLNARSILTPNSSGKIFNLDAAIVAPRFNDITRKNLNLSYNQISNLPGAQTEVQTVLNAYPSASYNPYLNEEDFNELVQLNPRILHIATHAIIDSVDPMSNKILLFQQDSSSLSDNYLHLFELKNKKIITDLVILNTCNSGRGQWLTGEGLSSLSIAFKYAGSTNVISTLWSIPDLHTSDLMKSYYSNISKDAGKNNALRNSKINYIENQLNKYTHPYYWAGLIYYGDNESLATNNNAPFPKTTYYMLTMILLIIITAIFYIKKTSHK